jgi:hypothetical protein
MARDSVYRFVRFLHLAGCIGLIVEEAGTDCQFMDGLAEHPEEGVALDYPKPLFDAFHAPGSPSSSNWVQSLIQRWHEPI